MNASRRPSVGLGADRQGLFAKSGPVVDLGGSRVFTQKWSFTLLPMRLSSETLALLSLRLKSARCCSVLHVSRLAALWTACLRRSMLFPTRKRTLHAPREPFPSVKLCIAHHSATISESAKTAASRRCATRPLLVRSELFMPCMICRSIHMITTYGHPGFGVRYLASPAPS